MSGVLVYYYWGWGKGSVDDSLGHVKSAKCESFNELRKPWYSILTTFCNHCIDEGVISSGARIKRNMASMPAGRRDTATGHLA